jgi:Zn-dependent membrane protease YugP
MSTFFLLFLLPMIAGFAAQAWVRRAVARAQDVPVGMSGAEAAHRILARHGAMQIRVETSPDIAAHECGHALQHHTAHTMFRVRSALAPSAAVASQLWVLPLMLGIFAGYVGLIWIAVALFSAVLLFHLVTLPVEIDASRRAMRILREDGMVTPQTAPVARGVLTAAASTYLVAALTSIAMLIFILGARR